MAYFSNGSEGAYLYNQCLDCIHYVEDLGCPVALVQMLYNYDQMKEGNEKLREAMNLLINENGQCLMKPVIEKYFEHIILFGKEG